VYRESCGSIFYPEIGQETNLIYLTHTECFDYVKGPNPANREKCYLFYSVAYELYLEERRDEWDEDTVRFMTFSEQADGSFFWSWLYGTVVKTSGTIYLQ
jgi:hypothetical protein